MSDDDNLSDADNLTVLGQLAPDVLLPWARERIAQDAAMIIAAAQADNDLNFAAGFRVRLTENGQVVLRDDASGLHYTLVQPSECLRVEMD
jgi:hypothetical protein